MDNRLGEMTVFLAVAGHGSFAAAAKALRLTPSAISRTITRLEARLGVQLATRTTRALALTAEGEAYRDRIAGLMAEIDGIERSIAEDREPRGLVRVNSSVPFGTQCLLPILPRYLEANPGVSIDLILSDALAELISERADVAIRIGPVRDTNVMARKLGESRMLLVASPQYLRDHGIPAHPRELDRHRCLRFNFRRSIDTWPFLIDGKIEHRTVAGQFLGSSGDVVRLMAVAGGGIARFANFHVAADLAAGRLVEVLGDFRPGDTEEINALFVGHERLASRVRSFLDFLTGNLRIR